MFIKSARVAEKYKSIRQVSVDICAPLSPEDHVVQPIVDVSPPKWHLGHTTWFFETFVLIPNSKDYVAYDTKFPYLFNSYYESAGERILRTNRGNLTRPSVDEILKYRSYVDMAILELLDASKDVGESIAYVMELGFQHEQQHQELLLTDIKYILGHNPLFPAYNEIEFSNRVPKENFKEIYLEFQDGIHDVGYRDKGFCFDNELGAHNVYLHRFQVLNRLITNGEYLEFMEAGGYDNFKYWLSEGWDWINANGIKCPLYWMKEDKEWHHYTLCGVKKLNPYRPLAHVSFYEANAFANWKGKRMLTEFEWEVACNNLRSEIPETSNFYESGHFTPIPREMKSYQFFGDVWEWTNSAYLPYPYYNAPDGALGEYNGKFMINQMVLRGGSCVTSKDHIRSTYRNFFQPHQRWQFSGIRLAETLD